MNAPSAKVIACDVLVIGGGIAGCFAAIKAREHAADVVLVCKGFAGKSGASIVANNMFLGYTPEDDVDAWLVEACRTGEYLDDQRMEEIVIRESHDRRADMERWGVRWIRQGDKLVSKPFLGLKTGRVVFFHSAAQLMSSLRGEASRRKVRIVDRVMVTDLLTSDGQHPTTESVVGAVGFSPRSGAIYQFRARAVVMAAGDWGMNGGHPLDVTGDGQAMAWRAGAQMRSLEQLGYSFSSALKGIHMPPVLPIAAAKGVYVNARGERFMEKYAPEHHDLASRAAIVRAIAQEIEDGNGPIYMDWRALTEDDILRLRGALPSLMEKLDTAGIDLRRDLVECTVSLYGNGPAGGIRVNEMGESTLSGLFCGGGASDRMYAGVPGLTGAAVFGCRAGNQAAQYALQAPLPDGQGEQASALLQRALAPRQLPDGIAPNLLYEHVQDVVDRDIGVLKHAIKLQRAIQKLEEINREQVPRLKAHDWHELMRANEVRNIAQIAELIARLSLVRTESRYFNYRVDYPRRDDVSWLKWLLVRRGPGGPVVEMEDIPLHKVATLIENASQPTQS